MASITQKIPRYLGGITDQPDELKIPGQLREATNVVPDVALGLLKRPGSKYITQLTDGITGKWFHIHKNNPFTLVEQYIGLITKEGKVQIWDLATGKEMSVIYADELVDGFSSRSLIGFDKQISTRTDYVENYFEHEDHNELQVLTVNDYTFVTNRKTPVSMSESVTDSRPYEAFIELRAIAANQQYRLFFNEIDNDAEQEVIEFTSANRLSVSFDGWSGHLQTDQENVCQRAGTNVEENKSFGSGTGLSYYTQVSCTPVPGTKSHPNDPGIASQYSVTVTLTNGGTGFQVGDSEVVGYGIPGNNYRITVTGVGKSTAKASLGSASTSLGASEFLDANKILSDLADDINALEGLTAEVIGTGIYVLGTVPFTVSTPDPVLMRVISATTDGTYETSDGADGTVDRLNIISSVNNVSQLPLQCKHGYIAKVKNSFEQEDDYYVKFIGNFEQDGEGVWEECAKPGIPNEINPYSMPHVILRTAKVEYDSDGDLIAQFIVGPLMWEPRTAGDENTVPRPSFCPQPGFNFGRPISNILFFRDRLVFLSDENIVMSRTTDYFNLFAASAFAFAADDPIDIAVSSTIPATLHDGMVINNGLLVVSPNQQFLARTDNDVLSAQTLKVHNISSYQLNERTKPLSLGTTVGFFNNAGKYSRFYEMYNIRTDQEPDVIEQSKVAGTLLPQNLDIIASSTENDMIFASAPGSAEVYIFRYFNTGEKRALSTWFKWEMPGEIKYHCVIFDSYYSVVDVDGKIELHRLDIRPLYNTLTLTEDDYRIHLDRYVGIPVADITYDHETRTSTFTTDMRLSPGLPYVVFNFEGQYTDQLTINYDTNTVIVDGDWRDYDLVLGSLYDMRVHFPTIYTTKTQGEVVTADTRASLVIHRAKINLGDGGYYEVTIDSPARGDRVIKYESTPEDAYEANQVAMLPTATVTVPVYDRNTQFTLKLKSSHPSPATVYSMEWEGDYNSRMYRSV